MRLNGPSPSGRWHPAQRAYRIGATSLEKVGDGLGICASADRRASSELVPGSSERRRERSASRRRSPESVAPPTGLDTQGPANQQARTAPAKPRNEGNFKIL